MNPLQIEELQTPREHEEEALNKVRKTHEGRAVRSCGKCTLCCDVLIIPELNKPFAKKCPYSCAVGCEIYKVRPDSCRSFRCAWIMGYGEKSDRPDKSGAIAEFKNGPLGEQMYGLIVRRGKKAIKALNRISNMAGIDVVIGK